MTTLDQCCSQLQTALDALGADTVTSVNDAVADLQPLDDIVNRAPHFVQTPGGALPTLSELMQRVTNWSAGFHVWVFHEKTSTTRTDITLPGAPADATKVVVSLNGVRLAETRDWTLAGDVLTLTAPLDIGDTLQVRNYGA